MQSPETPFSSASASSAPLLSDIERLQQELNDKMLQLERQKEELAKGEVARRNALIDECKKACGVTTDEDFIKLVRNRGIKSAKAKRLPETTLALMKKALANGATAGSVAKHFHVSLATVHERKRKWKLTHRKGVKPRAIAEALK